MTHLENHEPEDATSDEPVNDVGIAIMLMAGDLAEMLGYLRGLGIDEEADEKSLTMINSLEGAKRNLQDALVVLLENAITTE